MVREPAKKQMGVALGDALRAELEASATARGHSLAAEIRRRLEETYDYDTADRQTRDLMDSVRDFATLVKLQTGHEWHSHPAANRVMRHAITARLARLKPSGEPVFKHEELPVARLFAPGSDDPEAMGLAIEAVSFHQRRPTTTAEQRRESFEKTRKEILKLQRAKPKGGKNV
jgi:hypothetical protein